MKICFISHVILFASVSRLETLYENLVKAINPTP